MNFCKLRIKKKQSHLKKDNKYHKKKKDFNAFDTSKNNKTQITYFESYLAIPAFLRKKLSFHY